MKKSDFRIKLQPDTPSHRPEAQYHDRDTGGAEVRQLVKREVLSAAGSGETTLGIIWCIERLTWCTGAPGTTRITGKSERLWLGVVGVKVIYQSMH